LFSPGRVSVVRPFTAELVKNPVPSYKPLTIRAKPGTQGISKTPIATAVTGEKPLGFFGKKALSLQVSLKRAGFLERVEVEGGLGAVIGKAFQQPRPSVSPIVTVKPSLPVAAGAVFFGEKPALVSQKPFLIPGSAAELGRGKVSSLLKSKQAGLPEDLEGVLGFSRAPSAISLPSAPIVAKAPVFSVSIEKQAKGLKKAFEGPVVPGVKVRDALKTKVLPGEGDKSLVGMKDRVLPRIKVGEGAGLRSLTRLQEGTGTVLREFQVPVQKQFLETGQIPRVIPAQKQPVVTELETWTWPGFGFIGGIGTITPPPPPPSVPPLLGFELFKTPSKPVKGKKPVGGFVPQVKRRGSWVDVLPHPVSKAAAVAFGAKEAMETPARSFRAKASSRAPVKVKEPRLPAGWRKQFRASKSKSMKGVLVEKAKHAIDTPGERKGITFKGLEALARAPAKKRRGKRKKKNGMEKFLGL